MTKRKQFPRTDIASTRSGSGNFDPDSSASTTDTIPPTSTVVLFPKKDNAANRTSFDFARWYGADIDVITHAIQRQIERFLYTHDGARSVATITSYCDSGITQFLDYCVLVAAAKRRRLELMDIDRNLIDGFIGHISDADVSTNSNKTYYYGAKAVLAALIESGLIIYVDSGENATFPDNPFPGSNAKLKSEKPLPAAQRKAFAQAVKTAVMPLINEDSEPSGDLLAYALLIIALHTGRNTTPLLEMDVDCLRSHPKENVQFLVVYKRRGHRWQGIAVRSERVIDGTPTVWHGIARLINRTKELTAPLRDEVEDYLKDRLWLYRSKSNATQGKVFALNKRGISVAIEKLVADYKLQDANGKPLRINVRILRQTFATRMYEILDGDLAATASALGNTPPVAGRHYMKPGELAEKNWKFMGTALHQELLTGTIGATEKTPTGQCSDSKQGQFAPKNGATCMSFMNCLRCRNYVITGDDLYRLFSFYWLIVRERDVVEKRKWRRKYAHIIRLIDRDVIEKGIQTKVFARTRVDAAREKARVSPHPFWSNSSSLEIMK